MKKIICSTLALLMAISPLSALALADAAPPGTTPVKLTIAPLTFKATVPTGLPFDLDASGITLPATEASIINGTMGPIKVVKVTTTPEGTWTLTNYTDDFTSKKVNSKDLALQLNTDNVQSNGGITLTPQNWPTIEGNGNLRLDYQGKFAPQEEAITATVAHVSFVLDWEDAVISEADIEDTYNPEHSFTSGDIKTINFSFKDSKSDKVVFESSNPEVATVELVDTSMLRLVSGIKQAKITAFSNGTTTITGTLEDGTKSSIEVTVTNKAVKGLVVKSFSDKTTYIEGENFDATGLVVEAVNNNGTSEIVNNYTLSNNTNLTANQPEVILSYNGYEISLPITVVAKAVTSISVTTPPTKTNYVEGNTFIPTGMVVTANYDNGTTEVITTYTLINNTNLTIGQQNITISYNGKTVDVPITVVAKSVDSISVTTQPTKTVYSQRSTFNDEGLKLRITYNNNTTEEVARGWTVVNGTNLATGQTSVSVRYGEQAVDVPIIVDKYIMATDSDFSGATDGGFRYIGTAKYIEVPHVIKGVPVTSYNNMFANTSVEGVKSTNKNVTNMSSMFSSSKATALDVSSFNTSNVTNMSGMFLNSQAKTINLSSFDTSKVTNMRSMFQKSQATTLDLSNFDTSKVTNMIQMFYNSSATTLDLSNFDTSNVTDISSMFEGSQAKTINLSSFNTSKVTNMGLMFAYSKATTLDLSKFDTSNVIGMSDMFASSLATKLDLSSFNTSKVTHMTHMFDSSQATTLDLSNFDTSKVTDMSSMFFNSKATTGYARTQVDANKFNASSSKPVGLVFVVRVK